MTDPVETGFQLKDWVVPIVVALIVATGAILAAVIGLRKRGNGASRSQSGNRNIQVGDTGGDVHVHGAQVDVNELARTLLEHQPHGVAGTRRPGKGTPGLARQRRRGIGPVKRRY